MTAVREQRDRLLLAAPLAVLLHFLVVALVQLSQQVLPPPRDPFGAVTLHLTSAARVAQLSQENEEMRNEILMLESEPSALDRAIREELDMVLPGEIVVRFTRSKSSGAQPPATTGQGLWLPRLFGRDGSDRKSK